MLSIKAENEIPKINVPDKINKDTERVLSNITIQYLKDGGISGYDYEEKCNRRFNALIRELRIEDDDIKEFYYDYYFEPLKDKIYYYYKNLKKNKDSRFINKDKFNDFIKLKTKEFYKDNNIDMVSDIVKVSNRFDEERIRRYWNRIMPRFGISEKAIDKVIKYYYHPEHIGISSNGVFYVASKEHMAKSLIVLSKGISNKVDYFQDDMNEYMKNKYIDEYKEDMI